MEYTGYNKPGSKKIAFCYLLLFLFPGLQILFNAFDNNPVDYSINNFINNIGMYSGVVAFASLLPALIPAFIGWYIGNSTDKCGNENGKRLKQLSIVTGCLYVSSVFIKAIQQN